MLGNGWDAFGTVAKKSGFPDGNTVTQKVYRMLLPEMRHESARSWIGEGFCGQYFDQQFKPFTCPEPGPNGAPIKMIHRHGGSFISTMTDTNRWVRMYQSPNLEFVVMQDCHWQSETKFGDVILPASTNFEHSDISEWTRRRLRLQRHEHQPPGDYLPAKCIEPLWESKPDYEIYNELARAGYSRTSIPKAILKKTGYRKYSIIPTCPSISPTRSSRRRATLSCLLPQTTINRTVSNRWFYEGRPCDTSRSQ